MAKTRHVKIGELTLGNDLPFVLIAGPCALESRAHALEMSHALTELAGNLGLGFVLPSERAVICVESECETVQGADIDRASYY